MRIRSFLAVFLLLPGLLLPAGCGQAGLEPDGPGTLVLSVGLPETKTSIGPSDNGHRKVCWADGDCLSLGGTVSAPLSGIADNQTVASFTFQGEHALPFDILYPASYWKDASTVTLPAVLDYTSGPGVPVPLACRSVSDGDISLGSLCAVIGLQVLASQSEPGKRIVSVEFRGGAGEQVSGDFAIDYAACTLAGSSQAAADQSMQVTLAQDLNSDAPVEICFPVPARTYASGFSVTLTDSDGGTMTMTRKASAALAAGRLIMPSAFSYSTAPGTFALEIPGLEQESLLLGDFNVQGKVTDTVGNPLEGVVVSDGVSCTVTTFDGCYGLHTDESVSRFVFISTPSGYLPEVSSGVPRFYQEISSLPRSGGIRQCDFTLTPVANPDNCTLFISADLQPRARSATYDKLGYKSTTCCNDLYKDMTETAAAIKDRQVYGITLGDIVHENMDLFDDYVSGISTTGFPTYNVIGNHDHNPDAADDAEGAADFEDHFGPANYSFNIGKMHFVVLDNMVMYRNSYGLKGYNMGLTAQNLKWLQADLSYVDKNTTIMLCAHAPMFRRSSGSEASTNEATLYGSEYAKLFRSYRKVHAWAGHTHATFNYVYPSSHSYRNIEVHTLARSTGELWTNEYLSAGTPRGYTVVEVRNGEIASWRFHPNKYQTGVFQTSGTKPSFSLCEWSYVNYVAKMSDGSVLDDKYQMHIMPPSAYGDGKLYVNVFLWDTNWENPVLIVNGSRREMEQVEDSDRYDAADKEMRTWYKTNTVLKNESGYTASDSGYPHTLFRVSAPSSGTGTVVVEDRFGNEYRRTVSW